jgi:hypothetical protein
MCIPRQQSVVAFGGFGLGQLAQHLPNLQPRFMTIGVGGLKRVIVDRKIVLLRAADQSGPILVQIDKPLAQFGLRPNGGLRGVVSSLVFARLRPVGTLPSR